MNSYLNRVYRVFVFSAVIISCSAFQKADAADGRFAFISAMHGSPTIERFGTMSERALAVNDNIYAGDIVRTGPDEDVTSTWDDGSTHVTGPNSAWTVGTRENGGKKYSFLSALVGLFLVICRPDSDVKTPVGHAIVRGTDILLNIAPDGTTQMTVLSGDAQFENPQGAVDVTAGEQTTTAPGQAPSAPIAVDTTGLIAWSYNAVSLPLVYETPALAALAADQQATGDRRQAFLARLNAQPVGAVGWTALGDARRVDGDALGAAEAYQQALTLAPGNVDASVGLALTDLSRHDSAGAAAALVPVAGEAGPQAVAGLSDLESGNTQKALGEFESALISDPTLYSADSLLALTYLQEGDATDAETAARKGAAIAPNSAETQGTLSIVLFFSGKTREAAAASRLAAKADPQSPLALLTEGRSAVVAGRYDKAATYYENARAYAPDLWIIYQELGSVYDLLDRPKQAIEEYNIALNLDPSSADSYTGLGKALEDSGRYDDARSAFDKAIALAPTSENARYYYASFLLERGDIDTAIAQIDAVTVHDSKFGLLYSKLAEALLYKQDLFKAQTYAVKAVKLLPQAATAHYELGRVYYEEQRTYQAEEEFRIATVLDPKLATARYALGLAQEKTASDTLDELGSIFDSAFVGSPASSVNLNDLDSPGANDRIQAAVDDPTAIRAATRSYGNTELDGVGGVGSYDFAGSYLADTNNAKGVEGLSGGTQYQYGDRKDDDYALDTADLVVGQKAQDRPLGYLVLGDFEQTDQGLDNAPQEDPIAATTRYHTQTSRLTAGVRMNTGNGGRVLAVVQGSDQLQGQRDSLSPLDPSYNVNHFDTDSLDAEIRWNINPQATNALTAGMSYGDRRRLVDTTAILPPVAVYTRLNPLQAYVRDDVNAGNKWSFVGQLQLVQEFPTLDTIFTIPIIPESEQRFGTTKVVPYAVAEYKPDTSTIIRLRLRRLIYTADDFQLLTPTDDFLLSYADLPQAIYPFNYPISGGTSTELELDKTEPRGPFLSVGLYRQDLQSTETSLNNVNYEFPNTRAQGLQASCQASLSRFVTYQMQGKLTNAEDNSVPKRVPLTPNFEGVGTLQYLNSKGVYGQVAYYYQGDRISFYPYGSDLGAFGVVDLRIGKRIGLTTNIFAELNNALDKQYDILGVQQPGSQLKVGLTQRY